MSAPSLLRSLLAISESRRTLFRLMSVQIRAAGMAFSCPIAPLFIRYSLSMIVFSFLIQIIDQLINKHLVIERAASDLAS